MVVSGAGVLENDTDADNDSLFVETFDVTSARGAPVTVNPDGTFSYDPTSVTEIQELAPDIDPFRVGVDVSGPECTVLSEGTVSTLRIGSREARACQRLLRRVGGELCR